MTDLVEELFKKPKKDKGVNAPKFLPVDPGYVHQADLLFLPDDHGYKYALVVVDIGSRKTDAEPLKNKSSQTIKNALEKIYNRSVLSFPDRLEVDDGAEFKGEVQTWLKSKQVRLRVAKPGRHRQQAIVERRNQMIGKILFKRMVAEELQTGVSSTQWTADLPSVISNMNKNNTYKPPKLTNEYICEGDVCNLIPEGSKVRVALEEPRDVTSGKKLHGKFRDSDVRWEIKPRVVMRHLLVPNLPPMYIVSDDNGKIDNRQAYTKNQLLQVKDNEKQPDKKLIRPVTKKKGKEVYIVSKLVERKKMSGKIHFKVRWKGFGPDDDTWETRTSLLEDVPDLVKEFEKNN